MSRPFFVAERTTQLPSFAQTRGGTRLPCVKVLQLFRALLHGHPRTGVPTKSHRFCAAFHGRGWNPSPTELPPFCGGTVGADAPQGHFLALRKVALTAPTSARRRENGRGGSKPPPYDAVIFHSSAKRTPYLFPFHSYLLLHKSKSTRLTTSAFFCVGVYLLAERGAGGNTDKRGDLRAERGRRCRKAIALQRG